ncbi:MAG: FAD-containing oxidoreductase, partial [Candidatus Dadabacteria bacterium]
EEAGVAYDTSGVLVDDRLRTTNKRIFACGDIASKYKFTHAADAQARIVVQNALFFGRARASRLVIPWCTYTSPEVAHVGIYEREAEAAGVALDTITEPLSSTDRAVLDGEADGFLRLHLKKGTDKILGATLVAQHAGDMIGELALAVSAGIGLAKIAKTVHPYPTQGEIVKKAADAWRRSKLTPRVKKLLAAYFRFF